MSPRDDNMNSGKHDACPNCGKCMAYQGLGSSEDAWKRDEATDWWKATCPWCEVTFKLSEEALLDGAYESWPPENWVGIDKNGRAIGGGNPDGLLHDPPKMTQVDTPPDSCTVVRVPLPSGFDLFGQPGSAVRLDPTAPDEFADCGCPSHKDQHGKVTYNPDYKPTKSIAWGCNSPMSGNPVAQHYDARGLTVHPDDCTDDSPCWGCAIPPKKNLADFRAGKYDVCHQHHLDVLAEYDKQFKHETYAKTFTIAGGNEDSSADWFKEAVEYINSRISHLMLHTFEGTDCTEECPEYEPPVERPPTRYCDECGHEIDDDEEDDD